MSNEASQPIRIIGIKPGVCGALAVLSPKGALERLVDLPVIHLTSASLRVMFSDTTPWRFSWIDGGALRDILEESLGGHPARAVIERVVPCYRFNHAVAFGSVLSILQAARIPFELTSPSDWKEDLRLAPGDMDAMLREARRLFPAAELDAQDSRRRASALLIAKWALERQAEEAL